jgi:hypothetical protein
VVGVAIETKFVRPGLDPGSVLRALRAAGEKLLISSAANVNVSHRITTGVPSDGGLAIWVPDRDRIGIRAKDYSGDVRFGSGTIATGNEKACERQADCSGP